MTIVAVTTGLALIIHDRITELTVGGVGTIKAAAVQATSDAKDVADLKERVENQSATVDLVARQASKAKEISEEVAEQNKRAEQKLGTLNNAIDEATATLGDLKSVIEFTKTVVAAQNDDRKAFDKLRQWADDKSNPFSTKAEQAWNTIFSDHTKPFYSSGFTGIWKDGFDPSNLDASIKRLCSV
jgi:chromosome segregation ATPase